MNINKIVFLFLLLGLMLICQPAEATSLSGQIQEFGGAFQFTDQPLPIVIGFMVRGLLSIIGLVFFVLIVYGGWLYMTSMGNAEHVKKAKGLIINSVIGLIIVSMAFVIATYVIALLSWGQISTPGSGGSGGSGSCTIILSSDNTICCDNNPTSACCAQDGTIAGCTGTDQ